MLRHSAFQSTMPTHSHTVTSLRLTLIESDATCEQEFSVPAINETRLSISVVKWNSIWMVFFCRIVESQPSPELLRWNRFVVGNFHHLLERHQRHGVDRNSVADLHHFHHSVSFGHSRSRASVGREVQGVSWATFHVALLLTKSRYQITETWSIVDTNSRHRH